MPVDGYRSAGTGQRVLVRSPDLLHALKELDAMATFTVETLDQAAEAIAYVFE